MSDSRRAHSTAIAGHRARSLCLKDCAPTQFEGPEQEGAKVVAEDLHSAECRESLIIGLLVDGIVIAHRACAYARSHRNRGPSCAARVHCTRFQAPHGDNATPRPGLPHVAKVTETCQYCKHGGLDASRALEKKTHTLSTHKR